MMERKVTMAVPDFVYEIYAAAAKELKGYTVEQVISSALYAYAQHLFEDMRAEGVLPDHPDDKGN